MADKYLLDIVEKGGAQKLNARMKDLHESGRAIDLQGVDFSSSRYGRIDFTGCEFPTDVSFASCRFGPVVSFRKATFLGKATFDSAIFETADFSGATFLRRATFENARYSGRLVFSSASFGRPVSFKGLRVGEIKVSGRIENDQEMTRWAITGIDLDGASLSDIDFSDAQIFESSRITPKEITGLAFFSNCVFQSANLDLISITTFEGAKFLQQVDFRGARFESPTSFRRCNFLKEVDFSTSIWSTKLDFSGARFFALADFSGKSSDIVRGRVKFRRASFLGRAIFRSRVFAHVADFADAQFRYPPIFSNSEFLSGFSFENAVFEEHLTPESATAYGILRRISKDCDSLLDETRFHSLELRARRSRFKLASWERVFASLYQWTSNYGLSIGRPIWGLVIQFFAFLAAYWSASGRSLSSLVDPHSELVTQDKLTVLTFSLRSTFPFAASIARSADTSLLKFFLKTPDQPLPALVQVLAVAQTLVSTALLFLLLLAVRNQFRIK
jgi:uncharacterized protein YjbI with pentapeptide repeats